VLDFGPLTHLGSDGIYALMAAYQRVPQSVTLTVVNRPEHAQQLRPPDYFSGTGRTAVEATVTRCSDALADFEAAALPAEAEPDSAAPSPGSPSRGPMALAAVLVDPVYWRGGGGRQLGAGRSAQ
jgi:hypothetical protein